MTRCAWCNTDELYIKYHDEEWGEPCHNEQKLFEMICLEGAQAGLSWITVLRKRENYRIAFDNFDAEKMAKYDQEKVAELLQNEGIIRNRLKINAFIGNAKAYLKIREEFGSFEKYIWQHLGNQVVTNSPETIKAVPATTETSDRMSKDLKKRGFKFVGSTICYAFMQACGMVNDHTVDCWKRKS
jgi:DNA-3-methyladenine glycosylase I